MGVFRRRLCAEFYINNPQQCRAMGTAIDGDCSGNYFMLIFESPAFWMWKCDKGLSSEDRDLIEGLLRCCFVESGKEGSCVSSPELLQVRSGPLRRSGVSPAPPPPGRVWSWDDPALSHGWTQAPAALLFSVTEVTASLNWHTVITAWLCEYTHQQLFISIRRQQQGDDDLGPVGWGLLVF